MGFSQKHFIFTGTFYFHRNILFSQHFIFTETFHFHRNILFSQVRKGEERNAIATPEEHRRQGRGLGRAEELESESGGQLARVEEEGDFIEQATGSHHSGVREAEQKQRGSEGEILPERSGLARSENGTKK